MKIASSPMSAIEALQLDAAYVAVAKSLGLPTQSYMALSDGPILDAQAGAETFGSALIAALAGVNSVSGPGMLDFLLVFSLPKLVFDDEMCGQALRFVREVKPLDDLPGRRADRPADGRPAPDHGAPTRWPTGRRSSTCRARSSIATTARRGRARAPRTPTSARARRSTAGWPPTSRSRPTRPSTRSCARSSAPGCLDQTEPARDPRRAANPSPVAAGVGERRHNRRREAAARPVSQEESPS